MPARFRESTCSLVRVSLAVFLAVAVLAGALLSASPRWHESLHHQESAAHVCLVTICAAGQYDVAVSLPVLPVPARLLIGTLPSSRRAPLLPAVDDFSLLEHAPPALA